MEFEQIVQRLEWLDEQQRKNKLSIEDLGSRLTSLETSVNALNQLVRDLTKELGDLNTAAARLDQFDQIMTRHRSEVSKALEAAEKRALKREQDAATLHRAEISELRQTLTKFMDTVGPQEIERKFRERILEQQRLNLAVQDMRAEVEGVVQKNKELLEAQRVMEESQRQNTKRLADLQGEFTAVRKRLDEMREKTVLHADNLRNLENRLNELVQSEAARQEAHASFLQEQMAAQAERDRAWRDWREKYEAFKKQAETIEAQAAALDEAVRAARHAQDTYSELNQKLEKRIAEISEVQRLAEDRFRQEWAAFKAEEQKQWTNFSLGQEETLREARKRLDKMEQSLVALNDASQTLHDQLHQTTETTEKQLQELMNIVGDWVAAYGRIMGRQKTRAKRAVR